MKRAAPPACARARGSRHRVCRSTDAKPASPDAASCETDRKNRAPPLRRRAAPASASAASRRELDLAYGAYQRGLLHHRLFDRDPPPSTEVKDVKAMTLLGELYANGLGAKRDDKKAAEWYRLAAERGDREAMFALAMFPLQWAHRAREPGGGSQAARCRGQAGAGRRGI